MYKIKFNHNYEKLANINTYSPVTLLEVFTKHVSMLSKEFIDYDTKYFDEFDKTDKNFEIRNGVGVKLILIFIDSNGNLFTTIRDYDKEKLDKYINRVGMEFEVEFV